jgi:bacillithiol biosynthesis deacetylase BshB1
MVDVLVFAAHPDDAELAGGGLIAKCVKLGYSVGIVDLTRGELGSRGTAEERALESAAADQVLEIEIRENLGLPDGGVTETAEARRMVVDAIRRHRPTLVTAPYTLDLHPDHAAAGRIVAGAIYPSGFAKYDTGTKRCRPPALAHYMNHFTFEPSFILDISDVWETRVEAVRCYKSQLHNPDSKEPKTGISSPDFLERLTARFRHYGAEIGAKFGEPYYMQRPPPIADPVAIFRRENL